MTRTAVRRSAAAAFTILFTLSPVLADPPGSVTACASDTQVGAGLNLAQAFGFGGVIRFQCPPGTTIRITGRYVLKTSTRIEGSDSITLDGQGVFGPMLTTLDNIILSHLTVRGFGRKPTPPSPPPSPGSPVETIGMVGGSVLTAFGDAELDHVNIETSDFPVTVRHTATVTNAVFTGNLGGDTDCGGNGAQGP